jgi:protein SCO1/2
MPKMTRLLMFRHVAWRRLACLVSLCAGVFLPAMTLAQHDHRGHAEASSAASMNAHEHHRPDGATPGVGHAAESGPQATRITLGDTSLLDQNGKRQRLRSDAIGDRIVVVDFVYTTCTTVCPVLSAVMAQVQVKLATQPLRDVALLTLTVDPVRDTPARLKIFAAGLGAGPRWTWLTGPKPQVDEALKAFGAYTANFVDHPPLVLVGDARSGKWLRFYGFPTPEQLLGAVNDLSTARARAAGTS